ncbi:hypothetical protein Hanom_Chr05g00444481 [Helianthus anomalus]
MGAPLPLKPTPIGYGGAWVGGLGFGLAIESPPCHLTSPTSPPHVWIQTHANGAMPQTHAQTKTPGWCLGRFTPTHAQTPAPYPTA